MTKWLFGLVAVVLSGATAIAQGSVPNQGYPGGYPYPYAPVPAPGNFLPNFYNRQTQPLSPYLNLARGGNPGVNYYYGVRPGTTGTVGGTVPAAPFGYSQLRGGYIPAASTPDQEPVTVEADTRIQYIPSAAHPVIFGGGRPMVGGFTSGSRAGLSVIPAPATTPRRPAR